MQEAPTAAASVVKIFPILKDVLAVFGLIDPWNSEEVALVRVFNWGISMDFPSLAIHPVRNTLGQKPDFGGRLGPCFGFNYPLD